MQIPGQSIIKDPLRMMRHFRLLQSLDHLLLLHCVPGFCSSPRWHIVEGYFIESGCICYSFASVDLSPGNGDDMRKLLGPLAFCFPGRFKLNTLINFQHSTVCHHPERKIKEGDKNSRVNFYLETTLAILMESSNPECGEPSNSRLSLSSMVERPGNRSCPEEEEVAAEVR